jgi:sugar O-acyltransferase (sialic acid O-acetyltransferase NeuD family)
MTNSKLKIVIVGAGGNGRDVLWTLKDLKKFNVIGFIEENKELWGKKIHNIPVLGGDNWFDENSEKIQVVITPSDPKDREKTYEKIKNKNIEFPNIIHPSVIMSDSVTLSQGIVIQAGCLLAADAKISEFALINLDCTVGHDTQIKKFVTISPGCHIAGNNIIQKNAYLGSGVVTKEKISIGSNSVIGAGSVIINDIRENSLAVGIPAKIKKSLI